MEAASAFEQALTPAPLRALFAAPALAAAMLQVETVLAQEQARLGLISTGQAEAITAAAHTLRDQVHAQPALASEWMAQAAQAGSLAIPLVSALTQAVRGRAPEATAAVHWGATSQDIVDTAFCLQARLALHWVDAATARLEAALWALLRQYGDAPCLARTLLQPATVIPLGLRLWNQLHPVRRSRCALRTAAAEALVVQLGGAVGAASAWGTAAPALQAAVAQRLGLGVAESAVWQVQRDAMARLAAALGTLVGAVAKLAGDVALMSQAEVGELWEAAAPGRGTSSAMPHKRNPVGCLVARAAQLRAPARVAAVLSCMAQEFERGLGSWQAELPEVAELFALAGGAAQALAQSLDGATVDRVRMRRNIEALADLPQAEALTQLWAPFLGRDGAHAQVEAWCRAAVASGGTVGAMALSAARTGKRGACPDPEAVLAALDVEAHARALMVLNAPHWRWEPLAPLAPHS